jgi:hypothetical protein
MKNTLFAIALASIAPFSWAEEECSQFGKPVQVYSGLSGSDLIYTITDKTKTMAIDDDTGYVGLRLGTTALLHATQENEILLANGTDKKRIVDFTRQRLAIFKHKVESEAPENLDKIKGALERLDKLLGKDNVQRGELTSALDEVEKNFGNMKVQSKTKDFATNTWGPETEVSKLSLPDYHSTCDYLRLNPDIHQVKTPTAQLPGGVAY